METGWLVVSSESVPGSWLLAGAIHKSRVVEDETLNFPTTLIELFSADARHSHGNSSFESYEYSIPRRAGKNGLFSVPRV